MSDKNKNENQPAKKPPEKPRKQPASHDELYDDGDMATPKRDYNEDEIKEEEDKRL